MTLDTQLTLSLLQELLMALRANDAYGYMSWLALGIEELGRDVAGEVKSDWIVPLLVEEERDRLLSTIECALIPVSTSCCLLGLPQRNEQSFQMNCVRGLLEA